MIFDFTSSMQSIAVEAILTKVVTASVYSGTDANPSALISGASTNPTFSTVRQVITGGVAGVIYSLLCTVTTNQGQTIQQSALQVIEMDPSGAL